MQPCVAVIEILHQIQRAVNVTIRAEEAYRDHSLDAKALFSAGQLAHRKLLGEICELTDVEADEIEPAFTLLEKRLLHLREVCGDGCAFVL